MMFYFIFKKEFSKISSFSEAIFSKKFPKISKNYRKIFATFSKSKKTFIFVTKSVQNYHVVLNPLGVIRITL